MSFSRTRKVARGAHQTVLVFNHFVYVGQSAPTETLEPIVFVNNYFL